MKFFNGNCLDEMKNLEDNSIDSVVCDPPYGLSFMGKKWDYDVPSVEIWREALRVLKPGGYLIAFGGTRTQHRMAINIEDAGFEIRDMIAWVYGSGFPKSHNVSKSIDKTKGAKREVVGKKNVVNIKEDAFGSNNPNANDGREKIMSVDITVPATDEAKEWDGWGSALKPALEPITVARKPLSESNIASNVLKWGVGGINIDDCRVDGGGQKGEGGRLKGSTGSNSLFNAGKHNDIDDSKGRFPANFIHDGSDEVVSLFPETKSGTIKPYHNVAEDENGNKPSSVYGKFGAIPRSSEGSEGSAARFFYCAKASQSERDSGLGGFEATSNGVNLDGQGRTYNSRCGNCGKKFIGSVGTICECENPITDNTVFKRKNNHPTVKPIDLMKYLVRLVTPKGGTVLDPFMGSGSTGKACKLEQFDFVGIEMDKGYFNIAKQRIKETVVQLEFDLET